MTPTELTRTLLSGLKIRAKAFGLPRAHVDKFDEVLVAIDLLEKAEEKDARKRDTNRDA